MTMFLRLQCIMVLGLVLPACAPVDSPATAPAGAELSKAEFQDGLRERLRRLRERMDGPATSTSPPRDHLVVYSRVMLHVGLESVRPWGPQHTGEALLAYLEDTSENPRHSSVFPRFDETQWRTTPWTWRRILELLDQLEPEN